MLNRRGLVAVAVVALVVAAGCDVVRVSISSNGTQGNGPSQGVSVSGDASLVAFSSDASNLVPGDTNGASDVFVRDTRTNATSMVSVASSGAHGNAASSEAVLSANGRYVAFTSFATNLVKGAPVSGIYLRDLRRNTTKLVNRAADRSAIPLIYPGRIVISATGRFVAFVGDFKVYRYDRWARSASLVLDFPRQPTGLSRDGRYLATDTIVITGVHSIVAAVFDLTTAQVVFSGPVDSWGIRITPDAKNVVYAYAPNCFPSQFPVCTAGASGARLRNLETGEEHPVLTVLGQPYAQVTALGLSDDARRVAIATANNAYLFDRPSGAFTLVTEATNKLETGNAPTAEAAISADGTTVGFSSPASNLVANDTNGVSDAFSRRP
jgi:hypothetical protein